jgi:anti-anti-sigma factor
MAATNSFRITGPGRLRLECRGRIDVLSVAELRWELSRIVGGTAEHVTVDLTQVDHLDAAGVTAFAGAAAELRRRRATMILEVPTDHDVGRILDYCGLAPLLAA